MNSAMFFSYPLLAVLSGALLLDMVHDWWELAVVGGMALVMALLGIAEAVERRR